MLIFNFNTISFVLFAGLVAYGIFLGENRVRLIALGGALALFAASQVSVDSLSEISQKGLFGFHPTTTQSLLIIVGVIIGLFAIGAMLSIKKAQNKARSFILAIISALFIICFFVAIMPEGSRSQLVTDYNLAAMAYAIRYYVMLGFIVWTIITMFVTEKDDKKKH